MRVGIEAQRIFRYHRHGMDIAALELLKRLNAIFTNDEICIYAQPGKGNDVLVPTDRFHINISGTALYPIWEQKILPGLIKKDHLDLLHCTSNTAPISCSVPLVVTIHDVIYLEKWMITSGSWYQRFGNLYRRWNVPKIAKKADKIITVSEYEREQIIEVLKVDPERVVTIHNGYGSHFHMSYDKDSLGKFRLGMNLPEYFILFFGNRDPKKNLLNVLKALQELYKRNRLDFKLVITDLSENYLSGVLKDLSLVSLRPFIHLTGYIPNQHLPFLYHMAQAFLYPSIRESFGIPILEAMACGTPVITSCTSAMPEVAGKDALLVDPVQPEQIADMIERTLSNSQLRNEVIINGLKRVQDFSWEKAAQRVKEVYNSLI